jgi:hypothetical protein
MLCSLYYLKKGLWMGFYESSLLEIKALDLPLLRLASNPWFKEIA